VRYVITGGAVTSARGWSISSHPARSRKIVICDVPTPESHVPKTAFERADVRDREAVRATLERAQPDALVHLASILNLSHDETLMYDVDVNGTHNVLEAAAAAGTPQVLVT
jgi:UDP-glucose 4-epimerase